MSNARGEAIQRVADAVGLPYREIEAGCWNAKDEIPPMSSRIVALAVDLEERNAVQARVIEQLRAVLRRAEKESD